MYMMDLWSKTNIVISYSSHKNRFYGFDLFTEKRNHKFTSIQQYFEISQPRNQQCSQKNSNIAQLLSPLKELKVIFFLNSPLSNHLWGTFEITATNRERILQKEMGGPELLPLTE